MASCRVKLASARQRLKQAIEDADTDAQLEAQRGAGGCGWNYAKQRLDRNVLIAMTVRAVEDRQRHWPIRTMAASAAAWLEETSGICPAEHAAGPLRRRIGRGFDSRGYSRTTPACTMNSTGDSRRQPKRRRSD